MTGQQLKNSILQMAVQGKLVPQDPNDEPASVLLERIRKEKEELIKAGKIKKDKRPSYIFRGADNLPYEKVGKNEPVCIADEVPFDIPESWEWVRVRDVFQIKMGQSPKGDSVSNLKNGMEFHQGKVFFGEKYISISDQTTVSPTKIAEPNSILLCVRAPVGKVNITNRTLCVGRGLCALKPLNGINVDFAFYMFEVYENIFVKQATGTTFIAITGEVIKNQLIPLPPLSEQVRIISKIKEILPLISQYRNTEVVNQRLIKDFPSQLKKSILQEAVQGKLVPQDSSDEPASVLLERIRAEKQALIKAGKIKKDKHESVIFRRDNSHYEKLDGIEHCIDDEIPFEIPDNWKWVRFSEVALFENGDRSSKYPVETDYVPDGIPFFGAKDMAEKYMSFDDVRFISEDKFTQLGNGKLQDGDLICLIRGSVGKTRIFNSNEKYHTGFICAQMMIIRCMDLNILDYVYSVISSPYYIKILESKITGTAVHQLPAKEVARMLIPIPPLSEQCRIVQKQQELFDRITLI